MNQQDNNGTAQVDQRTHDLLNAGIDGEINAVEQDELDRLLLNSEAVRNLDRELRAVTKLLDDLPTLEPPGYLQNAIERQVRLPVTEIASEKPAGFLAWLNSSRLRTGLALAAGVVLTISVYEMGSKPVSTDDARHMTGTMVKQGKPGQDDGVLDKVRLDTGQLTGLAEIRKDSDLLTIDLHLSSEVPVDVVMDFAGRGLDFNTASNLSNSENAVSYSDGKLRLASNGEEHFTVKLRRTSDLGTSDPIELDVYAEDRLLKKAELNISRR